MKIICIYCLRYLPWMDKDDRRSAFIASYRHFRKGWKKSINSPVNSHSLNSNMSSFWSNERSSMTSGISEDACQSTYDFDGDKSSLRAPNHANLMDTPDTRISMTSSSSFISFDPRSNELVTSSQDNGPSSDASTPEENLGLFPLRMQSKMKLAHRKSSDDEEVDGIKKKPSRQRKKSNSKRSCKSQQPKLSSTAHRCSSPYPSSVTSSARHSSTYDTTSENEGINCNSKTRLLNGYQTQGDVRKEKPDPDQSNDKTIILEEDDVITEMHQPNMKEYQDAANLCFCSQCYNEYQRASSCFGESITFNVAGKMFEVDANVLNKYPNTLLGNPIKRLRYYDWKRQEYFLDRHRDTFQVILDFYNNGGVLQRPDEIPIDIFINELKYYAFDRDTLEKFLRDEGVLFVPKEKELPGGKIKRFIWCMFEDDETCLSKAVTITSALVIAVSIVVFCLETVHGFQSLSHDYIDTIKPAFQSCHYQLENDTKWFNKLTEKHSLEKRKSKHLSTSKNTSRQLLEPRDLTDVAQFTLSTCKSLAVNLQFEYTVSRCFIEFRNEESRLDRYVYREINLLSQNAEKTHPSSFVLFSIPRHQQVSKKNKIVNAKDSKNANNVTNQFSAAEAMKPTSKSNNVSYPITSEQLFDILCEICKKLDHLSKKTPYEWFLLEAEIGSPAGILFITETVCIVWFVLELSLRFLCCPNKKKFVKSFLNIIDALAILPYFITLIVTTIETKTQVRPQTATVLRTIRLVRMLRILKLSRYSRGFRILGLTLTRSTRVLFLLVCFQVVLAVLFSSIAYFVECDARETQFHSIPSSFWWALITMTTVGYGDVTPITVAGKITGACCAIMGILCISFPVPVIVSNFNYLYNLDKEKFKLAPEDLMEIQKEENDESGNVERFEENIYEAMKGSASGFQINRYTKKNTSELWNAARRQFRKISLASIDMRLGRSSPRQLTTSISTPLKSTITEKEASRKRSVRATSV